MKISAEHALKSDVGAIVFAPHSRHGTATFIGFAQETEAWFC
jgi:hypothetical protein